MTRKTARLYLQEGQVSLALRQPKGGYLVWRAIVTLGLGAGLVPGELYQVAALEIRQCLDLQVMEAEALLQYSSSCGWVYSCGQFVTS